MTTFFGCLPTNEGRLSTNLLTTLSSKVTSCFVLHEHGATWNKKGRKLNTCNGIFKEKLSGNLGLLISTKGPKTDNERKMQKNFYYFGFVIVSHNWF
jgi:hypothetical protein